MCIDGADWDDPLPETLRSKWECWVSKLRCLHSLQVDRCLKPREFGKSVITELHHFLNASTSGYGQCSYVRMKNSANQVACAFVMGKSQVVPSKPVTIPRLELAAAVTSIKVAPVLDQELDFQNVKHVYWMDSKVVLGYISNEDKRFHVYVANRVQQIKAHSNTSQWKYVGSSENPADIASRGLNADELVNNLVWLKGPEFLWKQDVSVTEPAAFVIDPSDPELKETQSLSCC